MNTREANESIIDVQELGSRAVNQRLKTLSGDRAEEIELINPESSHFLGAGLRENVKIRIEGSIGYYLGTCMDGPDIEVTGNAGWYPGDNVTSGRIRVEGSAGDGVGQGLYGGQIVVRGNCGSRTGQLMKGGTVIVGGNSGFMTGLYAFGGKIIILGNAGSMAGESILGGTIYIRGEVSSLGKNAKMRDAEDQEVKRINEIINEYGFSSAESFSRIGPAAD